MALQERKKIDNDGEMSDGHVSVKEYLMCEKIWDKFDLKNMGDYHNHYLKKDVLLLVDVFEKFINTCCSPGFSQDAMLKMTGVKLEKIQTFTCTYSLKKD